MTRLLVVWKMELRPPCAIMFNQIGANFPKLILKCGNTIRFFDTKTFQSGKLGVDTLRGANHSHCLGKVRTMREVPANLFFCFAFCEL